MSVSCQQQRCDECIALANYHTTAASNAALSAIIRVQVLRLAELIRGMIDASTTRRFCADELSRARSHLTTVTSHTKVTRCGRRCPESRIDLWIVT